MKAIEFKDVSFSYQTGQGVLKKVSFSIEKGEHVAIIGHNGSGKSTIAKLIVGLLLPDSGDIYLNETKVDDDNIAKLRKDFGIVFQNPDNQFVGVTLRDDIAFGMENRQTDRETMMKKIPEVAELVGLEKFLDRDPESLSGGEKQRAAIAGVLVVNPEVVIFDEATSMLDPDGVKDILNIVKKLKGSKTLITITHNLEEALLSDRIILMKDGEIIKTGRKEDVFHSSEALLQAGLTPLVEMSISDKLGSDLKYQKIKELLWDLNFKK